MRDFEAKFNRYKQIVQQFRPIDDTFMRCLFRESIEFADYVVKVILNKDLKIESCETQANMKRLGDSNTTCLHALCRDLEGKLYNIEIQSEATGATPKRGRYKSSVLGVENLNAGNDFSSLPETYSIFITENDIYNEGYPVYTVERTITNINKNFDDGEHIIYVNGSYNGDDEIGNLMHDFRCSDYKEMKTDILSSLTKQLKNSKGELNMCRLIEDLMVQEKAESLAEGIAKGKAEGIAKEKINILKKMLSKKKYTVNEIADITDIPVEEIERIAKEIQ